MSIRPIERRDERALREFVDDIPEEDRNFFKEDVAKPGVLEGWLLGESRGIRLISTGQDGAIAGVVTVAPGVGRSGHVGDLRVVVAASARRRGVGRALTREALLHAVEAGMSRITVDVAAGQQGAIEMFRDLGFVPEALLRDRMRDASGDLHDIVVLAHSVEENWASFRIAGVEEVAE